MGGVIQSWNTACLSTLPNNDVIAQEYTQIANYWQLP